MMSQLQAYDGLYLRKNSAPKGPLLSKAQLMFTFQ